MQETDKAFTGSIPALYDRYLGPLLFEPYAADLARRLGGLKAGRLLETAAGTGILTRALAAALPAGVALVATDLNQPMLDFAAGKSKAANVTWRQADALALPFEDGHFDAVVCQFGVMFFPDKSKAFREALRVLKPGGRFLFSVWDRIEENEVPHAIGDAVAAAFPQDPPGFLVRTPYGYYDTTAIGEALRAAGFARVETETVTKRGRAPSHRDPVMGFCQGSPLRAEIEARAPAGLEAVTDAAAAAVAKRFGRGPIDSKLQAHVIGAYR